MATNTSKTRHIAALDFDISKAEQQLAELQQKIEKVSAELAGKNWTVKAIIEGTDGFGEARQELSALNEKFDTLLQKVEEYKTTMASAEEVTSNVSSRILQSIEQNVIYGLERAAHAAYDMVKTTEDSMTDISRVLGLTANQTENMREQMFGLGQDFGRSFEDVSAVTLRFAQAGYDMADSIEMSKTALLALNTAELDVENGTQSLIGIISQWGMEASDLITVIDKLNYTADNNAITTQDLVDGLLKASSMAKTAGMSFDDTVGVLTAMKVASGAAGKEVGNAFKSIMAYIQRPESLKLFDDMGIDVFADKATGELLPMMQILEGMTNKWNTSQEEMLDTLIDSGDALQMMSEEWARATNSMDEYTQYQNAMAEATDKANTAEARAQAQAAAGVFRRNYYISLMENFNDAVRISDELINAEGHSMAENGRYMETLTAKVEQLITALTELAVTAADAGLLDVAKEMIDLVNAIVRFISNTKAAVPLVTALALAFAAIRFDRIQAGFNEIVGALAAARDTFVAASQRLATFNNTLTTANNVTNVATVSLRGLTAATSLVTAGIGLVISALSIAKQKMQEAAEKEKELINSTQELAEKEKDEYNSLQDIITEYETYKGKLNLTKEEKDKLCILTEQLVDAFGNEASEIDLVNGKYDEQIRKLRELSEEALNTLENSQRASLAAANNQIGKVTAVADYNFDKDDKTGDAVALLDKFLEENYNYDAHLVLGDNSVNVRQSEEGLIALSNAMDLLKEKGYSNTEVFIALNDAYAKASTAINDVKQKSKDLAETLLSKYIAEENNAVNELTLKSFPKWENGLVALAEDNEYLAEALKNVSVSIRETVSNNTIEDIFNGQKYEGAKKELIALSEAGKLNAVSFEYTAAAHGKFFDAVQKSGGTINDVIAYFEKYYGAITKIEDSNATLGLTEEQLKKLASAISNAESKISSLNGYIQQLNEGNGLTAQQVIELCDTYGLLAEQFTLTEKGYTIEISALEQLRDAQSQAAISARLSQAGYTEDVINSILQRIQAYTSEVKSIQTVADAQKALALLEAELVAVQTTEQGGTYEAAQAQKQIEDIRNVIKETEVYTEVLENLENLENDLYSNLGRSFEKASDSTSKADSGLTDMISRVERFADMGVYSVEEVIARFEEWRRTMDLGAEDLQKLEDKLHALYAAQIEEGLKATEEQFNDAVDAIEKEYDTEKEELEKTLDEESELRKKYWDDELDRLKDGLNTEIDNAKKAYEEKKKLTQKSYDSQIEALENLRNTEIENIESTYNAQIEALEKIKAARQAQRNEEDYEAQRAELLEQISYWEQRTGTEAVENLADLRKQLDELDRDRKRELEDEEIENQISDLESRRDNETAAAEKSYKAQIAALKAMQEQELELYESTYNAQVEMLEKKLESEVKAMEERRDKDLKLLEEEHEKKLDDLENEKNAAIAAEEEKWAAIQAMFTEGNIALIASAAEFAPQLYQQFHDLFTEQFKMDLGEISDLINEMSGSVPSLVKSGTGSKPTEDAPTLVKKGTKSLSSFTGGSGFAEGDRVSVTGEVYTTSNGARHKVTVDGEKGNITDVDDGAAYPYKIGNMGWVSAASLVQARTGGLTTADGIAMLHRDELIVNPELVKGLKAIVDPKLINAAKMAFDPKNYVRNTYNNNTSAVYGSSDRIQNNSITINNTIEDSADANAVIRKFEREMSRKLSKMM